MRCDDPVLGQPTPRNLEVIKHGHPVRVPFLAFLATAPDHPNRCCTHFPYHKACPICRACRVQHQQCRRKSLRGNKVNPDELPVPKKWLGAVTTDHASCGKYGLSRNGDTRAVVVQYRHTTWLCSYPVRTNNAADTAFAFRRFVGPPSLPEHI